QPLAQKVARKRQVRSAAYRARARLALRLRELFLGEDYSATRLSVVWSPVTPRDGSRRLADERLAVLSGLRSRRTAMTQLGVENPEREFARWLEEEREAISAKAP
ncbi:MAG: phage portal protein, partial [Dehalococcoidia bacterium]|nr:phage portal protein [Dehalococcoidia bacterium]